MKRAISLVFCAVSSLQTSGCVSNFDKPLLPPVEIANSSAATPTKSWSERSGKVEALAHLAERQSVKLLYQAMAGEGEFLRTPGLRNCDPDRFDVPANARSSFEPLGADYSESVPYSAEEMARLASATRFARDYNLTMFQERRNEVLKICPSASTDQWSGRSGEVEAWLI